MWAQKRTTRWALLSDTHIAANVDDEYRGFRPYENLKQVVSQAGKFGPDGIVIDGDLARLEGLAPDYRNLTELLEPLTSRFPVGLALGNHDHRKNFLAAFQGSAGQRAAIQDRHVVIIDRSPVRLVLLDSLITANQTPGLLGKAQRTWLDEYLAANAGVPTLLFVHHTLDDRDTSLLDSDRFLRIATKHPHVKAVFYGHSHEYKLDTIEGMHLINVPATGYNFKDSEPVGWLEAGFAADGAEFTLRAIGGNKTADGSRRSVSWRG
jgi:3',5'-cyclic AMP phosphodiesterase CpdA